MQPTQPGLRKRQCIRPCLSCGRCRSGHTTKFLIKFGPPTSQIRCQRTVPQSPKGDAKQAQSFTCLVVVVGPPVLRFAITFGAGHCNSLTLWSPSQVVPNRLSIGVISSFQQSFLNSLPNGVKWAMIRTRLPIWKSGLPVQSSSGGGLEWVLGETCLIYCNSCSRGIRAAPPYLTPLMSEVPEALELPRSYQWNWSYSIWRFAHFLLPARKCWARLE